MYVNGFSELNIDENLTLKEGLEILNQQLKSLQQTDNPNPPLIIKLIDRPNNFIKLPTQTDLFVHDCIHVLLGIGTYLHDESFVMGFTMGNSLKINFFIKIIYKFFLGNLYPYEYKFSQSELMIFDLGFRYGKSLSSKNIYQVDFKKYLYTEIVQLRRLFDISVHDAMLNQMFASLKLTNLSPRITDVLDLKPDFSH